MSVDVDAVNERLNGLVTLLQAVGVDSGDVAGISKGLAGSKSGGANDARQLDDSQIEAIIRKLQQAQSEAPQIIAALEAHAEARSIGGNGSSSRRTPEPTPPPEPEVDEDESEEDEEEGNYPMVGHGVSDDVSIMSDLTTPTVCSGVPVPEEEHYRDTLPPMIVGGGGHGAPPMLINPTKRKNLVSQVRPGIAPPRGRNVAPNNRGGGAASRRKNHNNHVVSRLAQEAPVDKPGVPQPRSKGSRPSGRSVEGKGARSIEGKGGRSVEGKKLKAKKKVPRPAPQGSPRQQPPPSAPPGYHSQHSPSPDKEWAEAPPNTGWNAFESNPRPVKPKSATVIDNDGFLVGDSFDPFQASSPAGDLAFAPPKDHYDQQQQQQQQPRRNRPSKQNKDTAFSQQPLRKPQAGAASAGRPRRARRASLAM